MRGKFVSGSSQPWMRGKMKRTSATHRRKAACRVAVRKARLELVGEEGTEGLSTLPGRELWAASEVDRPPSRRGSDTTVLLSAS